jgi:hypothetical protein
MSARQPADSMLDADTGRVVFIVEPHHFLLSCWVLLLTDFRLLDARNNFPAYIIVRMALTL